MIGFRPTRIELLNLKKRLLWARDGAELLRNKREALMKEFFGLIEKATSFRERLDSALSAAVRTMIMAGAYYGEESLRSASISVKPRVSLNMRFTNLWGVVIPEIEATGFRRSIEARDFSPIAEGIGITEVAEAFEDVMTLIVDLTSNEVRLRRLGEEIRRTTRRINVLEEVVIPETVGVIKRIEAILGEREREDIFRMKRFKKKRDSI